MKKKIKQFFNKISERVSKHPTYLAFTRKRDILADNIRVAVMALFSVIGPLWKFFFLKTGDPDKSVRTATKFN